jgi:hypothetical protein
VLTALRQRDPKRTRGIDGVFEEQLVEPGLFALISIYCSIIGVAEARLSSEASSAAEKASMLALIRSFTEVQFFQKNEVSPYPRAAIEDNSYRARGTGRPQEVWRNNG